MFKKLSVLVLIVAVIASEFGVYGTGFVGSAYAQGTPQIVSIDPSSGAQVGVTVNIRARVDGSSDFRAMRICFRDRNWCQESGELDFTRSFPTGDLGPGWYTIRVEVAAQGDNSWSSPTSTEQQYELTSAPQQPTQPSTPHGPNISGVSFNPSGGAQVGDTVTIHIVVDSSNPGAITVTPPCGGIQLAETTSPEFNDNWNTNGCGAGTQTVRVCARDVNDPNWAYATCVNRSYSLSSPPAPVPAPTASFSVDSDSLQVGQCTYLHWSTGNATAVDIDGTSVGLSGDKQVCPNVTTRYSLKAVGDGGQQTRSLTVQVSAAPQPTSVPNPVSSFSTGDIIKIGYDVYVIIDGARRHVPNPDTLDALGISQNEVNNKGFSDSQLSQISRGSDIPDVNKDPSGFQTFKATFFASRSPIKPNNGSSPSQLPSGGNNGGIIPPPFPTATTVQAQQSEQPPTIAEPIPTPTFLQQVQDWLKGMNPFSPPEAQAYVNTECDPQCVKVAGSKRMDLYLWASGAGTPNRILEIAQREPSFPVGNDQYKVRVRGQNDAPQADDLIIWPNGCGGSWGGGHIGYIESGNPLRITDSNWPSVPGPVCSRRNNQALTLSNAEKGCVRFITTPYRVSAANQPADKCSRYTRLRWVWCKITGW